jgi:hypothetical protein
MRVSWKEITRTWHIARSDPGTHVSVHSSQTHAPTALRFNCKAYSLEGAGSTVDGFIHYR